MASTGVRQIDGVEPRLAAVETEISNVTRDISALTADVKTLFEAVKRQGENFSIQIQTHNEHVGNKLQELSIAVTNAAAPRQTNWQLVVMISGSVLALWASVMSPVYMRISDTQSAINETRNELKEHLRKAPASEVRQEMMMTWIEELRNQGSPSTREKLATIDAKIKQLSERFNGSKND